MTKENKKEIPETKNFMDSLKANENLKTTLNVALKNSNNLLGNILAKLGFSIRNLIIEFNSKNKNNTKTTDNDLIQIKALREHCFDLVGYTKENQNKAFEMVVSRAIRLAIMWVDNPSQFNIDEKTNKIFVMSKIATPLVVEKLEGQKAGTRKKPNTSEDLVEVNTGIIDRCYKVKYPTRIASRKPKTKDAKDELNFKELSKQFLKMFNKISVLAKTKNAEFVDYIDEKSMETLGNIKASFDAEYNNIRNTYDKYEIDIDGEKLEKKVA